MSRRIRVAVVGGGPTGLTAAILLRQAGVDVSLFEQHASTCELPQAHQINGRSGEILRQIGVYDELDAAAPADEITRHIMWVESLAGTQYGGIEWSEWNPALSPCRAVNIGQDVVERVLAARLADVVVGGGFGYRVAAVVPGEDRARVTVERPDGNVVEEEFDYVLACDGASSGVRRSLGVEMVGPPSLAKFVTTYFRAPLFPYLAAKPGPLRIVASPGVWGSLIGYDMDSTWAFMCAIPEGAVASDYTDDVMREFIARVVGDRKVNVEITATTTWNMSAQVAAHFRRGRVFLLGDAAHRFPPTGGLGLNTGLQDAHNIAWKLALIDRGLATEALLDSYESERRPVSQRNCDQSVANAVAMAGIDQVLGASALAPLPPSIAHTPAEAVDRDGERPDAQAAFDALRGGIDFASIDFGYTYGEVAESGAGPFTPSVRVGGLLPAVTFEDGMTLLDAYDKARLTLFVVDPDAESLTLARKFANGLGLPLHEVVVGSLADGAMAAWRDVMGADLGAVLVRPDGHAAWVVGEGSAALLRALESIAGAAPLAA